MKNIDFKGLLLEEDFILKYKTYNLTPAEAMFYIQLNYLSNQGEKMFDAVKFASKLDVTPDTLFKMMEVLYKKNIIKINKNNKIQFLISEKNSNYFTLKELLQFVEKKTQRILSSKEIDIVSSWFDKEYVKNDIIEAFNISNNIHYANGILNNKVVDHSLEDEDDILKYDWLGK